MSRIASFIVLLFGLAVGVAGQALEADPQLEAAEALVGRALFLRHFPAQDDLGYNATGRLLANEKRVEWTLAGIDVKKASRKGSEVQIEGVRVTVRFNADSRQFERRPQNEESIKIRIADTGSVSGFLAALDAIFAQGIDLRLQGETPLCWRHYFDPGLPWPADGMDGTPIDSASPAAKNILPPVATHKADARLNAYAQHDKVRGTVQVRLVVDTNGMPGRIAISRPLGYGLDESAVDSVAKWRFTPAMRDGKPIAVTLTVNYEFQ